MLGKFHALPSSIGGESAMVSSFDVPLEQASYYRPLLYQAGYLTIKHYNPITALYTLDIPNAEVRTGMMRSLLPAYLPQARLSDGKTIV